MIKVLAFVLSMLAYNLGLIMALIGAPEQQAVTLPKYQIIGTKVSHPQIIRVSLLVEPNQTNKDILISLMRWVAKDYSHYDVVWIDVYEDKKAYDLKRYDQHDPPVSPKQVGTVEPWWRAFYAKGNKPPLVENFWYRADLGNKEVERIDLRANLGSRTSQKTIEEDVKFKVVKIEYQQVPSRLYIYVNPPYRSIEKMTEIVCKLLLEHDTLPVINFFDHEEAAEKALDFYSLPQYERDAERIQFFNEHHIATYSTVSGRNRGVLTLHKAKGIVELSERPCKIVGKATVVPDAEGRRKIRD